MIEWEYTLNMDYHQTENSTIVDCCKNSECPRRNFIMKDSHPGHLSTVKLEC